MNDAVLDNEPAIASFIEVLRSNLPDPRDNRGKRHPLVFTVVAVALALACERQTVSSIHHFICLRLPWLRKVTGMPFADAVSRAHLPRLLNLMDWEALNATICQCFRGGGAEGWVAVDGKALRGSGQGDDRQAVVIAVCHSTGDEVASVAQSGVKTSEIPVVRQLLKDSGLERSQVTLDALHCNPETLGQIAKAEGTYLTQIKENQPELLNKCQLRALQEPSLAATKTVEKGHGRVTTRRAKLIPLRPAVLDKRWRPTKPRFLVEVIRETYTAAEQHTTQEVSYYITNDASTTDAAEHLTTLCIAIRSHWRVESNNWVRDVTMGEDSVRVKATNQAQVLALLRGLVLTLARKAGKCIRATLERFCLVPAALEAHLRQVRFL